MNIIDAIVKLRNDILKWCMRHLNNKVDKEDGKGLSSNDYTTAEKEKLAETDARFEGIIDSLDNKSEVDHTHDNVIVYDTISGAESITVEHASATEHELTVVLSSNTYTDFSDIMIQLTSDGLTYSKAANTDGTVTGLRSMSSFTLSLYSENDGFDASEVTITCTFQIDLEKTLQSYVLDVDAQLDNDDGDIDYGDSSIVASAVVIDTSLSIAGAAADAKAVGDALSEIKILDTDETLTLEGSAADAKVTGNEIKNLKDLVGELPVKDQIALAFIDEVYVQDTEPENVPDGSVWVDTSTEELQPGAAAGIGSAVYVEDVATTDASAIDFSKYSVGDVILVTVS